MPVSKKCWWHAFAAKPVLPFLEETSREQVLAVLNSSVPEDTGVLELVVMPDSVLKSSVPEDVDWAWCLAELQVLYFFADAFRAERQLQREPEVGPEMVESELEEPFWG